MDRGGTRAGTAPDRWFLNPASNPQREQGRQQTHEEHRTPWQSGDRLHEIVHDGGQCEPHRPGALHERQRLGPMSIRPGLRHERGAAGPFGAHAEPQTDSKEREGCRSRREAAGSGEYRVDQHARHERADPAEPIGDHAEHQTTRGRRQQRQRLQRPGCRLVHVETGHHRGQHQRIQTDVERVQHPAERRRDERAPRRSIGFAPPEEHRRLRRQALRHWAMGKDPQARLPRAQSLVPGARIRHRPVFRCADRSPGRSRSSIFPGNSCSTPSRMSTLRPHAPESPPSTP